MFMWPVILQFPSWIVHASFLLNKIVTCVQSGSFCWIPNSLWNGDQGSTCQHLMPVKRNWQEQTSPFTLPCSRFHWSDSGCSCKCIRNPGSSFVSDGHPSHSTSDLHLLALLCSRLARWILIGVLTEPVLLSQLLSGQWHSARAGSTRAPPYTEPSSPYGWGEGSTLFVVTFALTEAHPAFA